ncbi:MAG: primosomal protein N' [Dehalococcoidia bacterium]|nr:primosomal protein N' [Dehalococcoidia bacterium]
MNRAAFAEVAVNAGHPARTAFTYAVPEGMEVAAGQAVFVPFGQQVLQGIVLALTCESDVPGLRPISAVADPTPALSSLQVALARWMSDYYLAPLWDCVALGLPPGYGQKPVTMVSPVEVPPLLPVDPKDHRLLAHIAAHGQVTLDALQAAVGGVTRARLRRLQEAGYLTVAQGLVRPSARARLQRRLKLARPAEDALARAGEMEESAPRSIAARLLRLLAAEGDITLAAAREVGATSRHLRALEGEGLVSQYTVRIERHPLAGRVFPARQPPRLNAEQQQAVETIAGKAGTFLLHGVTGSGKTEVYLELVQRTLDASKGAIILVPEISLTPQAVRRYGERFGDTLAIIHSALGVGERFDQWEAIRDGDLRVVVGSRSALFAPVRDLGLVVIDEEHEWTYKQTDPSPRYHARETARELCRLAEATLVLGSATPDVVTYHDSERGIVRRVELESRVAPGDHGEAEVGQMPQITVVDMREELKSGNRSVFSFALRRAIRSALGAGEQSILFVNRRGSARFLLCRDCGYVPQCPSCEIVMGLDEHARATPQLRCHHCGRSRRLEEHCPRCHGPRYRPFGVGTQKIEALARQEFPGARVARWDSDVAGRKGSHERMVETLEAGEIDILVGTQMLAKGLDLPQMMVVGVVDADVGLSLPEYHAHERAFQLLSQVAGRAGRRDRPGTVVIQTYEPDAAPIQCAAAHDYRAFYEHEIAHRRRAGYPPFARLVRLVYQHRSHEHGLDEASRVATGLRTRRDAAGRAEPDILGPSPAFIPRIRGRTRWQILLRGRNPVNLLAPVHLGEGWTVDVDPASLL